LPALTTLANSTSHLSACPTRSSSQSTASAKISNGRMSPGALNAEVYRLAAKN
jgi:hypothetical protein